MKFVCCCLLLFIEKTKSRAVDTEKVEFCRKLECEQVGGDKVCGLRPEGEGLKIRLFENICELMKHGCRVKEEDAYGIIKLTYCEQTFTNNRRQYDANDKINDTSNDITKNPCNKVNCIHTGVNYLCGLRQDGERFKIRLFFNECDLLKYNCEKKLDFYTTDIRTCKGMYRPTEPLYKISHNKEEMQNAEISQSKEKNENVSPDGIEYTALKEVNLNNEDKVLNEVEKADNEVNVVSSTDGDATAPIETTIPYETDLPIDYEDLVTDVTSTSTDGVKYINGVSVPKNIVVLDGGMLNYNGNINETIDNFIAATHMVDFPLKEVTKEANVLNNSFRRRHVRIFHPVTVFRPWIEIPENRTELAKDYYHLPTLNSCFHKCPTTCPDTYAPVCGTPGTLAREPSVMFKNHCFMDAAQCLMRWEDKSETAESSLYTETSVMFCLGDAMNGLSRFLPLIRTLQHMGRLKKRAKFHYNVRNMKYRSEFVLRDFQPMG